MKTLVFANQKGGVGKSAVATPLAQYGHRQGQRVLAIDFDDQAKFSRPLARCGPVTSAPVGADSLLTGDAARHALPREPFVLVPAADGLLGLKRQPAQHTPFARRLRDLLSALDTDFDLCVIDTHPSPDIVPSPIQLNREAIDGVAALLHYPRVGIHKIKAVLNPKLDLVGLLPTLVEATPFQNEDFRQIVQRYTALMIQVGQRPGEFAFVPKRSAIAEAQAEGLLPWAGRAPGMSLDLSALDGPAVPAQAAPPTGAPLQLPVDAIDEDPRQPRRELDDEPLRELAQSIADRGVRQSVSVRPHPDQPGRWMLNFGARRLRASKIAGKAQIPAFVDETADSYDQVIENEHRQGLKPLELALFVQRQMAQGETRAEIARKLGKSRAYVTFATALIDAPDWLEDLYRTGRCRGTQELHALRQLQHEAPQIAQRLIDEDGAITRQRIAAQRSAAKVDEPTPAQPRSELDVVADSGPQHAARDEAARGTASRTPAPATKSCTVAPREIPFPAQVPGVAVYVEYDNQALELALDSVPRIPGEFHVLWSDGRKQRVPSDHLKLQQIIRRPSVKHERS